MKIETLCRYLEEQIAHEQDPVKRHEYEVILKFQKREHFKTCEEIAFHLSYWVTSSIAEDKRHPDRSQEKRSRFATWREVHAHYAMLHSALSNYHSHSLYEEETQTTTGITMLFIELLVLLLVSFVLACLSVLLGFR